MSPRTLFPFANKQASSEVIPDTERHGNALNCRSLMRLMQLWAREFLLGLFSQFGQTATLGVSHVLCPTSLLLLLNLCVVLCPPGKFETPS